jgi:multidrug efflux pump subunit AcrA (membrane-fusion protein)
MEIDVQNRNGDLSPGMYADIILYSNGNINALTVPSAAVVISTERKYVLVSKNRKIIKVEVTTGNEMGGKTEVFGNLQPGDKVIVNAGDEVKENS